MPDQAKFYLTTPIYYVNARPHIGHAYTTIVADVIARRHRLLGDDTFFLTGTDEHGQKIERSAAVAGMPPQHFADQVSDSFRNLWKRMGITNDAFIRTTDPRHKQGVQRLFQTLQDRGHIYLSTYTGQYCVSDEAYVDGPPGVRCPDCGRVTETVSESNYYFRLSAFQRPLLDLIEPGPNGEPPQLLITPDSRRNEVLSFLRGNTPVSNTPANTPTANSAPVSADPETASSPTNARSLSATDPTSDEPPTSGATTLPRSAAGTPYVPGALRDLSISRTSFKWGIPVPGDEDHVIYVWLDALANYMTAIGYGSEAPEDIAKFKRFWPADLHLVGKEIIRFHCIYWPAFLLALNPRFSKAQAQQQNPNAVILSEAKNPEGAELTKTAEPLPATEPGAPFSAQSYRAKGGVSDEVRPHSSITPELSPEQHQAWAEKMLPKAVTAHGWLLFEDSKMSKSKGNIVRTETILDAFGEHVYKKQFPDSTTAEQDLFAADVLRYFLLREIPFGQDGSFSFDALIARYNADLANGYGNLVSRTLSMIEKNHQGVIPDTPDRHEPAYSDIIELTGFPSFANEVLGSAFEQSEFGRMLFAISTAVARTDTFLTGRTPWKTALDPSRSAELASVLYTAAESIRIITALLHPILPFATAKVWAQLGLGDIQLASENGELRTLHWGGLQPGTKLGPLSPIFPRADKGFAQIMADIENPQLTTENGQRSAPGTPAPSKLTTETITARETPLDPTHPAAPPRSGSIAEFNPITQVGGSASPSAQLHKPPTHTEAQASGPFASAQSSQPIAQSRSANPSAATNQITIDDFAKVELRVARILVAERIPKADKLLRLEVDLGYEKRQILSGIAEWYSPEELIGRKIVVITNLAPRKMRGLESHGMLLAASSGDNGKPVLATFAESDNIEPGARLK